MTSDCMDNVTEIGEHQPHLVVDFGNQVHVLPVSLIRAIACGKVESTPLQAAVLAKALLGEIDG